MGYLDYVNVKMGTESTIKYSTGNTLPLCQLPFGMVSFCPQTELEAGKETWFYKPRASYMEGIRLTHQPSPWIGDYGTMLFVPQCDQIKNSASSACSSFLPTECQLSPDYIKVRLIKPKCTLELAPSERCAIIRLSYEGKSQPVLSIFSTSCQLEIEELDKESKQVRGVIKGTHQADAPDFKTYFVLEIGDALLESAECGSEDGKTYLHLPLSAKNTEVRVGISYISYAQALVNMEREIQGKTLEQVRERAKESWEEKLSRIKIEADEKILRTFYSCMYRAFLFPHKAYEIEKNGECVHYAPLLKEKRQGVRYTDSGFWDTYRTQLPLFTIIAKKEFREILQGFIVDYVDGGWLPRWSSMGEVGCMPSTLIESVIADGATKGLLDDEMLVNGFLGMVKNVSQCPPSKIYGRAGLGDYLKYGYVPSDLYGESVNLTVDYSYGDWCVCQVADRIIKRNDELCKTGKIGLEPQTVELARRYYKECGKSSRKGAYKRLFDKERCFIVPKNSKGEFRVDFDPYEWGYGFTECAPWQGSLSVVHDIEGLSRLYGGRNKLLKRLDEILSAPAEFRVGSYGAEIHEMSEMARGGLGQLAISNQPSFHLPFIYAHFGKKSKTRALVKKITTELFSAEEGFPGDEDNGSMASWYILATIGKYQICPGKNKFIEYRPLVKVTEIKE